MNEELLTEIGAHEQRAAEQSDQLRADNERLRLRVAELELSADQSAHDWMDDDNFIKATCAKHGISGHHENGEFKTIVTCVDELSALRTKAVEALEKAAALNTGQDCPSENMAVVVAAMNALTALRGDNAGGGK